MPPEHASLYALNRDEQNPYLDALKFGMAWAKGGDQIDPFDVFIDPAIGGHDETVAVLPMKVWFEKNEMAPPVKTSFSQARREWFDAKRMLRDCNGWDDATTASNMRAASGTRAGQLASGSASVLQYELATSYLRDCLAARLTPSKVETPLWSDEAEAKSKTAVEVRAKMEWVPDGPPFTPNWSGARYMKD